MLWSLPYCDVSIRDFAEALSLSLCQKKRLNLGDISFLHYSENHDLC